jgi:hypothetical protein
MSFSKLLNLIARTVTTSEFVSIKCDCSRYIYLLQPPYGSRISPISVDKFLVAIEHCTMNSAELKTTLQELNITQADLARLLLVTPRGVNLWINESRTVPGPAEAYLRLFRLLPPNLRQIELNRLKNNGTGMRDGIYGITFEGPQASGMGLLILDAGRVYGADAGAARYDGDYLFHEDTGIADIVLKVTFPPNIMSVFGIANPYEWAIDVSTSLDPKHDSGSLAVRTSLGQPLIAQFKFLRSLPESA